MTSRKDPVIESPHIGGDSRFDVDLEEQMGGLKLDTAENSESSSTEKPESIWDHSAERKVPRGGGSWTKKSEYSSTDKSESSSAIPNARYSLELTAQKLVIETFKHLGSSQSVPPTHTACGSIDPQVVCSENLNPAQGVEVHFEGIESKLIEYLNRADGVKMCAAWFTSTKVAEQLSLMGDVGLIIGSTEKITPGHPEYRANWVHTLLTDLPDMVFVYGGASGKRLMHNKFMVLFRESRAYAVITGSYNYTYSAAENWENIVYIESEELGQKYFAEYSRILQYCQPLNRYVRS